MRVRQQLQFSSVMGIVVASFGCGQGMITNGTTEVVGELTATVSDDLQHGKSTTEYWLKPDDGVASRLDFAEPRLDLPLGSRVSVTGRVVDATGEPTAPEAETHGPTLR